MFYQKVLTVAAAVLVLAACTAPVPQIGFKPASSQYTLAERHWDDVAKIRAEAQRLVFEVRAGNLTKVQAAQYLNRYRLGLVGRNSVDDSVYEVYQRAAVDSQRGAISSEQSKAYVENTLRGWQQRWPHMTNKPTNPAFTNFLLEYMGMQPLK